MLVLGVSQKQPSCCGFEYEWTWLHWDCCVTVLTCTCTNACSTTYSNSAISRQLKVGFHLLRNAVFEACSREQINEDMELPSPRQLFMATNKHTKKKANKDRARCFLLKWRVVSLCWYVLSVFFSVWFLNVCLNVAFFSIPLLIGRLLIKHFFFFTENRGAATNTRKSSQTTDMVHRRRVDGILRQHVDETTSCFSTHFFLNRMNEWMNECNLAVWSAKKSHHIPSTTPSFPTCQELPRYSAILHNWAGVVPSIGSCVPLTSSASGEIISRDICINLWGAVFNFRVSFKPKNPQNIKVKNFFFNSHFYFSFATLRETAVSVLLFMEPRVSQRLWRTAIIWSVPTNEAAKAWPDSTSLADRLAG